MCPGRANIAFLQHLPGRRKRFQRARKNPEAVGNGKTVIGDGHAGLLAAQDAAQHFPPIPHAGTAMDHQLVRRQVVRKIAALHVLEFGVFRRCIASASVEFSSGRCLRRWDDASRPRQSTPGRRAADFRWPACPAPASSKSPLNRDIRIEKLVSGTPCGVSAATFRNAWESVTTSFGGVFSRSSALRNSRSFTTRQYASLSSKSRMASTCGRISRPLGASLSIGTTRTTSWPGPTRSPRMDGLSMKSGGAESSSACRKSSDPRAAGGRRLDDGEFFARSRSVTSRRPIQSAHQVNFVEHHDELGSCGRPVRAAFLLQTLPSCRLRRRARPVPSGPEPVWFSACVTSPSSPVSSMPAVSMNSTGPSGSSSIGFSTGSVVVPATGETIETCWRVIAFSRLDLPTLRRPKKAMCRRRLLGAG